MGSLYPLRFQPILRRYLWGGRRLELALGKTLGPGHDYAESWELVDHGVDQSRVVYGSLAGQALGDLVRTRGEEIFGPHSRATTFPLLFKFLDAQKRLSVQVHPNDAEAALLTPPDLGKTEAWVILAAEPGSVVYAGLKRGFDRAALAREVSRGTTELCLHQFSPQVGDCLFVPAGAVHALGQGLLVAEIQQASDTTFRLFDWNRVGANGQPRELHVAQALDVIDYALGPLSPQRPLPTQQAYIERLVACDKFVLDRWRFNHEASIGGRDRFHIVAVLEGAVNIAGDAAPAPLARGGTLLIPAATGSVTVMPLEPTVLLDIYLPG